MNKRAKINKASASIVLAFVMPVIISFLVYIGYVCYYIDEEYSNQKNYSAVFVNAVKTNLNENIDFSENNKIQTTSEITEQIRVLMPWVIIIIALSIIILIIIPSFFIGVKISDLFQKELNLARWELESIPYEKEEIIKDDSLNEENIVLKDIKDFAQIVTELRNNVITIKNKIQSSAQSYQQTHTLKTKFLATMSHDLRSPLNAIIGFTELLMSGAEGEFNDEQKESLKVIYESSKELLLLITTILDWAKIEVGKLKLERKWITPVEVINRTTELMRESSLTKDININVELQAGLPPLFVDKDRLVQGLICLIRHSIEYSNKQDVTIKSYFETSSRFIKIEVNSKEKISPLECEKIFEAFYGIEDTQYIMKSSDIGLNLALVKAIVEMHNGSIGAKIYESSTSYTINLPL